MNLILKNLLNNAEKRQDNNSSPPFMGKIRSEKQDRPLPEDLIEHRDIPYGDPAQPLFANVLYPRSGQKGTLPVIVFVHGGALVIGDRNSDPVFCQEIARQGFLVYSVDYRLIDHADAFGMISDICNALEMVSRTLAQYGGDPGQVSLCGESAGAFLALYAAASGASDELRQLLGCTDYGLHIAHLVMLSGMIYTTRFNKVGLVYRKQLYQEKRKDRQFMARIAPDNPEIISLLPPVLLISSKEDFLREDTIQYAAALDIYDHKHRLLFFHEGKDLTHAFPCLLPSMPESAYAIEQIGIWLNE